MNPTRCSNTESGCESLKNHVTQNNHPHDVIIVYLSLKKATREMHIKIFPSNNTVTDTILNIHPNRGLTLKKSRVKVLIVSR